jgi:hypothetical protein
MDFRKADFRRLIPKDSIFTPTSVIFLIVIFGGLLLPRDYRGYLNYLVAFLVTPMIILDLIKFRKEDKLNGTNKFWMSLLNLFVMLFIMTVLLFFTRTT